MTEGECFINEDMAEDMHLREGDLIYQRINIYQNLVALIDIYNNQTRVTKRIDREDEDIVCEGCDS